MARRHNFQTLSWFFDLFKRDLLDLDPPYQRRSVWNQSFKDYFVDTVLMNYPSPAIFLFEDLSSDGRSRYSVVDGKQRLTTLFDFVKDEFPVADNSPKTSIRGEYFSGLSSELKKEIWGYQFIVEYIPTDDESIIDAIFDRLNRNVAKLSPQELRHARYDGLFIKTAEALSESLASDLGDKFPRITGQSRRQMKDVEMVSLLLLLLEEGPKGYSQTDLDKAFSDRDQEWDAQTSVETRFRETIGYIKSLVDLPNAEFLTSSRMRNQADFYSLFGAIDQLRAANDLPSADSALERLVAFSNSVDDPNQRELDPRLSAYYEAARSASNDRGPRQVRIEIVRDVMRGLPG